VTAVAASEERLSTTADMSFDWVTWPTARAVPDQSTESWAADLYGKGERCLGRQITSPADDEAFGLVVEIALRERRRVDRVEDLRELTHADANTAESALSSAVCADAVITAMPVTGVARQPYSPGSTVGPRGRPPARRAVDLTRESPVWHRRRRLRPGRRVCFRGTLTFCIDVCVALGRARGTERGRFRITHLATRVSSVS